jgi:hypothetical protein
MKQSFFYLAGHVWQVSVDAQHHLCRAERAPPAELQHLLSSVAALDLALRYVTCYNSSNVIPATGGSSGKFQ